MRPISKPTKIVSVFFLVFPIFYLVPSFFVFFLSSVRIKVENWHVQLDTLICSLNFCSLCIGFSSFSNWQKLLQSRDVSVVL